MRFNEKDVAYYSRSPKGRDREGYLQKRGETNPAFKQRWFVLKGNVLFYFGSKTDQEPIGFVLLENCKVSEMRDELHEFGISIAFPTPSSRSYVLLAKDKDDFKGWLTALQSSSVVYLREAVKQLKGQLQRLQYGGPVGTPDDSALDGFYVDADSSRKPGNASTSNKGGMLPSRHFASPSDSDKATNDALNNGSDLEDDNDDDNRGAGDDDDDDDDDDGADDDDDDDDDDNLGLDSEFDRRAGVGKPMYSRTFTDMMPLATATGGGDEDVDVGSFGTEGLLSTSPPVPDFSSLMPKVNLLPPPSSTAVSTAVTAAVFSSSAKDDSSETSNVLDVAFTASIIRPADYKDTLDTLDFQIIASRLEPITKMWIPAGRTEVSPGFLVSPPVEKITPSAKTTVNILFLVSLQLHHANQPSQYKFSLVRIEDIETDRVKLWGEVLVMAQDLIQFKETNMFAPIALIMTPDTMDFAASITVRPADPIQQESAPAIGGFSTCPHTSVRFEYQQQTYRALSSNGRPILVRESIRESPWAFVVPVQYMRFLVLGEKALIRDLSGLQLSSSGNLQQLQQRQVELHCRLLHGLQAGLNYVESYTGKSFRPSTSKKGEEMQFIALNCHIQNLTVSEGQPAQIYVHDCATFGAACAHGYGFKKGGLKTLLETYAARTNKDDEDGTASSNGPSGKATVSGIDATKDAAQQQAHQRSSSVYNVMKRFISREPAAATGTQQLAQVPSMFFENMASSNLSVSALAAAEPPQPKSVLLKMQNSARAKRIALIEAVATFNSLVDEIKQAAKISSKADRVRMMDSVRSKLYSVVHYVISQAAASPSTEEGGVAHKISQTWWPTVYSAVQNVAEGSIGSSAIDSLATALETLIRNFERLVSLILSELDVAFLKEDAASFLPPNLRQRLAAVQSQAITALVSIFASNLSNRIKDTPFQSQLVAVGYFAQFESLLSTSGDENGMLEDMYVAVRELSTMKIKLALEPSPSNVSSSASSSANKPFSIDAITNESKAKQVIDFEGTPDAVIIVYYLTKSSFDQLIPALRQGHLIEIFPVIITQGINEMQTVANHIGDTSLQDTINTQSFALIRSYMKNYRNWMRESKLYTPAFIEGRSKQIEDHMTDLQQAISYSKRNKNPKMLILAERMARLMNGGRLTSCKSAKDRTSMSVTLEQVLLLHGYHKMIKEMLDPLRDAMRSQGVRILNAKKNTGVARYAFNYFQTMTLPKLYRPPRGTLGGGAA